METTKKVSFDNVQVREYPVVLSLNPAGQYGAAIEIGWEYRAASEVPPLTDVKYGKPVDSVKLQDGRTAVNEYEKIRPSPFRRKDKKLYLFVNQREYYVKKSNFTDSEIQKAAKEKEALYAQRQRTNRLRNPVDRWKEGAMASRRTKKIKRAVRNLKKAKKNDKELTGSSDHIYSGWWFPLSAYIL